MGSQSKALEQVKFLKEEIKKRHRFLFIFMHEVIWLKKFKIPANRSSGHSEIFWTEIIPILNDLEKEVFIFAGDVGHNGTMFHNKYSNIRLISNGFGNPKAINNVVTVKVGINRNFKTVTINPGHPMFSRKLVEITQTSLIPHRCHANFGAGRLLGNNKYLSFSKNIQDIELENLKLQHKLE